MSSELQNKLLHYEVTPPEKVWDNIAASLDQDIPFTVSEKLFQFQETPPPSAWAAISRNLDHPQRGAVVLPFFKRYRRPLKYAGATAAMVVLAVLVSLMVSKKTESEVPVQGQTHVPEKRPQQTNDTAPPQKPEETNTLMASAVKPEKSQGISFYRGASMLEPLNMINAASHIEQLFPGLAEPTHALPSRDLSSKYDNYMVYSDDEGHAVRLPKKMYDAIACPNDDLICKQRIKYLQQQVSSAAVTADFTGLLEILNNMKENK
jgi:hypothetical protein